MQHAASLAKFAVPVPSRVFPRARLFARLDAARRGRIIWVSAPAGSGKTTTVAHYLSEHGPTPLWYHLDAADGDPATFFNYLTQAAQRIAPTATLPTLTAEYLLGLDAFARNYFRQLFACVRSAGVLVFDDYHDVPADSPLHYVFRQGLREVPPALTVIVISRNDPPPALARLRTEEGFTLIGRDELLLTEEETLGVSRLRLDDEALSAEQIQCLHRRTCGWMAGLVLMLEQARADGVREIAQASDALVFDYLAGEVFARMERDEQDLLLKTALLPNVTADTAAELAGLPRAGEMLEALVRRNYFTVCHRQPDAPPSYEYHPLFRQFLLARGRVSLAERELDALKRHAAMLLARHGAVEAAVQLVREIRDWSMAVELIHEHGPALLRSGRYRTLQTWLEALPGDVLAQEPWLQYYHGLARLPFDLAGARHSFENGYWSFKARDQAEGMYLTWAGIIETYLIAWDEFKSADRWISEFDALHARHPTFAALETEVRAVAAIFAILAYRQPSHPQLEGWAQKLKRVLFQDIAPNLRMTSAQHLLFYLGWIRGELNEAGELVSRLQPFAESDDVAPLARIAWLAMLSGYHNFNGEPELALRVIQQGLALAEDSGVHLLDPVLLAQEFWASLISGRPNWALIGRTRGLPLVRGHMHDAHVYHQRFLAAVWADDLEGMLTWARAGVRSAEAAGAGWPLGLLQAALARALIRSGDRNAGLAQLAQAERIAEALRSKTVQAMCLQIRTEDALTSLTPAETTDFMRRLFELLRQLRGNPPLWHNHSIARLCAFAIAHGIETDHARHLVRRHRLEPPSEAPEHWPWPVRIYTLGRFEIVIDDVPLRFGAKVQKKPLDLLKVLLAHSGRQIPEATLAETLWPDADGDTAHRAFVTTLQRLRRLLGGNEFLLLRDGRLSLNDKLCWLDLWAFESGSGEPLRLYRGPFLAQDPEATFALPLRERLRASYVRHLLRHGETLEAMADWAAAISVYEEGLAAEEAVEEFYQRLMVCHAARGHRGEVVAAYQRCAKMLALRRRLHPSQGTEALYRKLTTTAPDPA